MVKWEETDSNQKAAGLRERSDEEQRDQPNSQTAQSQNQFGHIMVGNSVQDHPSPACLAIIKRFVSFSSIKFLGVSAMIISTQSEQDRDQGMGEQEKRIRRGGYKYLQQRDSSSLRSYPGISCRTATSRIACLSSSTMIWPSPVQLFVNILGHRSTV